MKIDVIVTDNNNSWSGIQTYLIPDEIMRLNIFFFQEGEKNTTLCRFQIQYRMNNGIIWNDSIDILKNSFIIFNNETKFPINEKQDAITVYKWLTGTDYTKLVKDLQQLNKENKLSKDF